MEFRTNKKTGKAYPLGRKNGVRSSSMKRKHEKRPRPSRFAARTNDSKEEEAIFKYPIVIPHANLLIHQMNEALQKSKWKGNRDEEDSFKEGFDRGVGIAEGITDEDLTKIKIGLNVASLDFGPDRYTLDFNKIENKEDVKEFLRQWAYDAETNGRDFSPFEIQAHELNERETDEDGNQKSDAWDAFEDGIGEGINAYFTKFFESNLN